MVSITFSIAIVTAIWIVPIASTMGRFTGSVAVIPN